MSVCAVVSANGTILEILMASANDAELAARFPDTQLVDVPSDLRVDEKWTYAGGQFVKPAEKTVAIANKVEF